MRNKFNLLSSSIILNRSRLNLPSLEIRLCYKAMCYHLKIALLQYEQLVYSIKSCEEYFLILLMHNFQIITWSQDCFELSNFSSVSIRSTCLSSMNSVELPFKAFQTAFCFFFFASLNCGSKSFRCC